MKQILVPMDFTDVGVNALRYTLNAFPDSSISVLYVKIRSIETSEPLPVTADVFLPEFWIENMENFIQRELKIEKLPQNVSIDVRFGSVVPTIRKYSKEWSYDAIIMGTRDKYNFFDKWFGTVSLGTVKTNDLPIYLIPKYATYNGFNQVMVASDDNLTTPGIVQKINAWNKNYQAFIKFLHIQQKDGSSFKKQTNEIVGELFNENNPEFSFEVAVLCDKDISHSLLGSAYNMNADLLMVIPENQSFLQSMVFRSLSRKLILKSDIPILFLKDKTQ